ncbi:MAG: hypothetical protein FWC60_09750 [Firmicutes bacterium]|nr:hypothetical protein [Bacillota bacterium]
MQILFEFERETKNTVRFQEIHGAQELPIVGTLYVRKDTLSTLGYTSDRDILKVNISKEENA